MGRFVIELTDKAKEDLRFFKRVGDKASIKKIDKIMIELSEHPDKGVGQPEQLKHDLHGFWSRRINHKDRLIYSVDKRNYLVEIYSAKGHYSDK
jgi:toxin YoeB